MCHAAKLTQYHRLDVAGVREAEDQGVRAGHRRLGHRVPRQPVALLAELVEHDQIAGEPAASTTASRLHLPAAPTPQLQSVLAVRRNDLVNRGDELRTQVDILAILVLIGLGDQLDRAVHDLFGRVEILRRPEHEFPLEHVQDEQAEHLRDRRLSGLASHQEQDDLEPKPALRQKLQCMDEEPLLPRKQGLPQHVSGEVDHRISERALFRLRRARFQVPQRGGEDARLAPALQHQPTLPPCSAFS